MNHVLMTSFLVLSWSLRLESGNSLRKFLLLICSKNALFNSNDSLSVLQGLHSLHTCTNTCIETYSLSPHDQNDNDISIPSLVPRPIVSFSMLHTEKPPAFQCGGCGKCPFLGMYLGVNVAASIQMYAIYNNYPG